MQGCQAGPAGFYLACRGGQTAAQQATITSLLTRVLLHLNLTSQGSSAAQPSSFAASALCSPGSGCT